MGDSLATTALDIGGPASSEATGKEAFQALVVQRCEKSGLLTDPSQKGAIRKAAGVIYDSLCKKGLVDPGKADKVTLADLAQACRL